jgi:hypothetical protein
VNVIKKTQARTHERCHALSFVHQQVKKLINNNTTNNLYTILLLTIRVSPVFLKAIFQIEEVERIKKGRRIAVDYLAWRNEPRVNVNGYLFIIRTIKSKMTSVRDCVWGTKFVAI